MPHITANGAKLYYEMHGPEDAEVLVLNNGIIANTRSWANQLPALTPHFRVLLYDMRGQGQSQKWQEGDPDFTWAMHADDLAALMDALGIEQAHIGGISYGGELAMVFALRCPERCRRLVVADAVSHVGPWLRAVVKTWIAAAETGDAEHFYRTTWYWNFSESFFGAQYELLLSRIDAAQALDLPSVVQLCRCFHTLELTNVLDHIQQPTCVIVGACDILKPVHHAETIASALPDAELHIIPGAGHATFWEDAEAFNSIVLGFLLKESTSF